MDGTRQDVLKNIDEWIEDMTASNILWIKGHPGVGKSAIASTVVNRLRGSKRLGACFFFERAKADILTPFALWRMVSFDLSEKYPTVRRHLVAKLDADRDIPRTGNVDELFRQLIHEPLMGSEGIPAGRLPVIVIDALDECGGLDAERLARRGKVLQTLKNWRSLPSHFKIVVTSRAENDIDRALGGISSIIEIGAGTSTTLQSSIDISAFLTIRLREIAEEWPDLKEWPKPQDIEQLVDKTGGLFIWARVVADFIRDGDPLKQLTRIQDGEGIAGDMAALYSHILQVSFPNPSRADMDDFHSILGAIIFSQRPLPAKSLSGLLEIGERSIHLICRKLSSVVDSGDVLKITHQSFTDFLINKKAKSFCINRKHEEQRLTLACLRTRKNGLQFNICKLESSYF